MNNAGRQLRKSKGTVPLPPLILVQLRSGTTRVEYSIINSVLGSMTSKLQDRTTGVVLLLRTILKICRSESPLTTFCMICRRAG